MAQAEVSMHEHFRRMLLQAVLDKEASSNLAFLPGLDVTCTPESLALMVVRAKKVLRGFVRETGWNNNNAY